jgi:diaminopimelate epimerase
MAEIKFVKMVASGNDFVVLDSRRRSQVSGYRNLAKNICDRKYGVGADGLLVLEKSQVADVKMRIFNADGSEAEMCGNGARCVALFKPQAPGRPLTPLERCRPPVEIETRAGIIQSRVKGDNVRIKLTDPKDIKLDIPITVANRNLRVNFIDTGVPHAVIFVEGLDEIRVKEIGRTIRYHKKFSPRGTNVDFIEALSKDLIAVRTYERGVEDETLACGTGAVASALLYAMSYTLCAENRIKVRTKSAEVLKVYFKKDGNGFRDVWLEGKARIVYKGEYYV